MPEKPPKALAQSGIEVFCIKPTDKGKSRNTRSLITNPIQSVDGFLTHPSGFPVVSELEVTTGLMFHLKA
jgi:hypothetical protein